MKNLKQYFYNPVCLCCGSFYVKNHLYCDDCFSEKIKTKLNVKSKKINEKESAFYVFEWIPFESDLLSDMVYQLKSDKCINAWEYYSDQILNQLGRNQNEFLDLSQIDYIVPIPGSKKSSVHAQIFANRLGYLLRKPILDILTKQGLSLEQKRQSRRQRQNTTISLCEQFTGRLHQLNLKDKHVLFIDDVLTTGSSFNQSIQALKIPKHSTLLTLFYRTTNHNTILVS